MPPCCLSSKFVLWNSPVCAGVILLFGANSEVTYLLALFLRLRKSDQEIEVSYVPPAEESLEQFKARLKRLDDPIRRSQGPNKPPNNPSRPPPRAAPPTSTGTHPGPMDLSANRGKISMEVRAKRMAEGLCLYCGGSGHLARNCPNRPAVAGSPPTGNRPMRAAAKTLLESSPPRRLDRPAPLGLHSKPTIYGTSSTEHENCRHCQTREKRENHQLRKSPSGENLIAKPRLLSCSQYWMTTLRL